MFSNFRRAERRAKHFGKFVRRPITRLIVGGWLGAMLVLVMTTMAGVMMPKAALATGAGPAFTVKLTDIVLDTTTVREDSIVRLTLTGTYSPAGNTLSDADRDDILSAARDAVKLGGTASLADINYLVTNAVIDSADGSFTINVDIVAIDDGIEEGTETLTLSSGSLTPAALEITDAPTINITVHKVSFSETNIEEGATSTLRVELRHDAGPIKVGENRSFFLNALTRVRNKVTFSGSASKPDRTIVVPARPGILGGFDPHGGTNYVLPVGQAVFYLEVTALEDDQAEGPETVIANLSGKSAAMVIFDEGAAIVPHLRIHPAAVGITGPLGARKANFVVTNFGSDAEGVFDFDVRITGPVVRPDGSTRGDLVRTIRFPAGSSGESVAVAVPLDEAQITGAGQAVTATLAPPRGDQFHQVGTPRSATINLDQALASKPRLQI